MLKAQNPSLERCVRGLPFLAISIFSKHEQTVLFFAGSEALGWVEQRDAAPHPCGGAAGCCVRRAPHRCRGMERGMAKGALVPGWNCWFPVAGSLCADPRAEQGIAELLAWSTGKPKTRASFRLGHIIQIYFVLAVTVPLLPRGEVAITPRRYQHGRQRLCKCRLPFLVATCRES